MRKRLFVLQFLIACCVICIAGITSETKAAGESEWVHFPYTGQGTLSYEYLYVVGGYHSVDNGCPAWGTAKVNDIRFIGDTMGDLVITYKDGTQDSIPLVFGYTMWYLNNWRDTQAPFKGDNADPDMKEALLSSLHLLGAYEANDTCVFKVKLQNKAVKSLKIQDNPDKDGQPVFKGAYLANYNAGVLTGGAIDVNTSDSFFNSHTIDSANPYPDLVRSTVEKINSALVTVENDFKNAPEFLYPAEHTGSRVFFSGSYSANIATGVIYSNLQNLINRTDADGFVHTSYKEAPSWRYDGFGAWVNNANSYYDSYYSRDGGRAIMTLLTYGQIEKAQTAVNFGNECMKYFPNNNVTFNGIKVPGHYTVVMNKPMLYSEVLVPDANWPTQYTKSKFGNDYKNLGNQETDGHGLMMLSNYNVWKNSGAKAEWVIENWTYINEGAEWILWCFENTDISFAKNGLLYAESEAGMMEYTLYCNVPCCLGMYGYAEMAEKAGKSEEADKWKTCAESMEDAITKRLSNSRGWIKAYFGFDHDPVITMMADVYGYDLSDMKKDWVERSVKTYENDIKSIAEDGYYGASGIGYNHSMITQNALLLDRMADASKLLVNLSKLSYAPKLDNPYVVPEGIAVDAETGVIRRQGDLGNLVQLSEALKCYAISIGISPAYNSTLKIMPRLPELWKMDIQKYDLINADGTVDMIVTYPENGVQTAQITLNDASGFEEVKFRFGPLPADTEVAAVQINGVNTACVIEESGDSTWVWVSFIPSSEKQQIALIYGDTIESLPGWPISWEEPNDKFATYVPIINQNNAAGRNIIVFIAAAVIAVTAIAIVVIIVVIKKRNKKIK